MPSRKNGSQGQSKVEARVEEQYVFPKSASWLLNMLLFYVCHALISIRIMTFLIYVTYLWHSTLAFQSPKEPRASDVGCT